jgi:type III secretion system low calcium response chaperone LcrH/SycD
MTPGRKEREMTTNTDTPKFDLNEDDVRAVMVAISDGLTPAETAGVEQEQLEALYSLGHRLYSSGELADAETAFKALCLYDYRDTRFWMGLGATLQAQSKLDLAAEVYGMAGLASNLKDPAPFFYAGLCQLKNGDLASADASLAAVESLGEPGDPKVEAIKSKAANLRLVIKDKVGGAGEAGK